MGGCRYEPRRYHWGLSGVDVYILMRLLEEMDTETLDKIPMHHWRRIDHLLWELRQMVRHGPMVCDMCRY